jgi:hypothetical protein
VTSGLDGIFLPGFPVARVVQVERDTLFSFARIYCEPVAGVENFGEVMVLDPREPLPIPAELPELDGARKTRRPSREAQEKATPEEGITDATDLFLVAHPAAGPAVVHCAQPDRRAAAQFPATSAWPWIVPDWVAWFLSSGASRAAPCRHGLGFLLGLIDGRGRCSLLGSMRWPTSCWPMRRRCRAASCGSAAAAGAARSALLLLVQARSVCRARMPGGRCPA